MTDFKKSRRLARGLFFIFKRSARRAISVAVVFATAVAQAPAPPTPPTPPAPRDTLRPPVIISPEDAEIWIESLSRPLMGAVGDTIRILTRTQGTEIAGFDFTIAYDPAVVEIVDVLPGDFLTQAKWEYFTYRKNPLCAGPCPEGKVKIISLARLYEHKKTGIGFAPDSVASLAKVVVRPSAFVMTDAVTPIRFFWIDCGDNTMSSTSGDELFVSRRVHDDTASSIIPTTTGFPSFSGYSLECDSRRMPNSPVVKLVFRNGRITYRGEIAPLSDTVGASIDTVR